MVMQDVGISQLKLSKEQTKVDSGGCCKLLTSMCCVYVCRFQARR